MFGSTTAPTPSTTTSGEKVSDTGWGFIKKKGRRHSSSQLPISSSSAGSSVSNSQNNVTLKKGALGELGDVAEHHESDDNDNNELIGRQVLGMIT